MLGLAGQVRRICSAGVIAASLWGIPHAAEACSCLPPPPPHEALEQSAAVFEGRAAAIAEVADGPLADRRYELEVLRFWKGELGDTVTITTASSSAACGRSYEIGEIYLVYAVQDPESGELRDYLCSRTRPLRGADEDLAVLGPGTTPTTPAPEEGTEDREPPRIEPKPPTEPPPSEPRRGCRIDEGPGAPLALGLVVLVALARRRRAR